MNYEHIFDQLEIWPDPFAVCELRGACDLNLGQNNTATLHYILNGHGNLQAGTDSEFLVQPGTLILVPALQSHSLRSLNCNQLRSPECKPAELQLQHLVETSESGNIQSQLIALCARIRVGLRGAEDVIDLIRNPMIESIHENSQMHSAISMLLHELGSPVVGSRAMIKAVLTQCLIDMLRRRLSQDDGALRWMAALRDPQVWEALRAMLDAPGDPHTVESLADRVGMSRSSFANRFSTAYGSGPIELLRDLRLRKASTLLCETDIPIKRIAYMVGFTSRTAFSRLFEQRTGHSPIQFRKIHAKDNR